MIGDGATNAKAWPSLEIRPQGPALPARRMTTPAVATTGWCRTHLSCSPHLRTTGAGATSVRGYHLPAARLWDPARPVGHMIMREAETTILFKIRPFQFPRLRTTGAGATSVRGYHLPAA